MLFLGTNSITSMLTPLVMLGALVFMLLFTAGFAINAVTDYDIDSTYGTFKSKLPAAVETVGIRRMWAMIILETVVAMTISLHITIAMASPIPFLLVVAGVFTGLGYSVKPFRFKERGLLHVISLGASAFYLPCLFLFFVISGSLPLAIIIFFLGFASIHYGMEAGNQAIDYFEDRENGVMTPPVRWGLCRSLWFGLYLMVIGVGIEIAMLPTLISYKFAGSAAMEMWSPGTWLLALSILLVSGYILPFVRTAQMIHVSRDITRESKVALRLRKLCKYSRWQFSGIMGLTIVSVLLFLTPMLLPLANMPVVESPRDEYTIEITNIEFLEGRVLRARVVLEVTPLQEEEAGGLLIRCQSNYAGVFRDSITLVLDRDMEKGDVWNVDVELRVDRQETTGFQASLMKECDDGTYVLLEKVVPSPLSTYITNVQYSMLSGYTVSRRANVTSYVYSENFLEEGTMELLVTVYSSAGIPLDKERVLIDSALDAGETMSISVMLDMFDSSSVFFKAELISLTDVPYDSFTRT